MSAAPATRARDDDPARLALPNTGIFVRHRCPDDRYRSVLLEHLPEPARTAALDAWPNPESQRRTLDAALDALSEIHRAVGMDTTAPESGG